MGLCGCVIAHALVPLDGLGGHAMPCEVGEDLGADVGEDSLEFLAFDVFGGHRFVDEGVRWYDRITKTSKR
jgi:hypothetical protein